MRASNRAYAIWGHTSRFHRGAGGAQVCGSSRFDYECNRTVIICCLNRQKKRMLQMTGAVLPITIAGNNETAIAAQEAARCDSIRGG